MNMKIGSRDGYEVEINLTDIIQLVGVVRDIYSAIEAGRRVDHLDLAQAKELSDRLWDLLKDQHEANRQLNQRKE